MCNVVFVYSLLVLDLLINITDNLFAPIQPNSYHRKDIDSFAFTIVILQIVSIFCVTVGLILHLFDASDKLCQHVWTQSHKEDGLLYGSMPQRAALKLVLDKYWWSILVGALYLVLTIILQIISLNPVWHYAHSDYESELTANSSAVQLSPDFRQDVTGPQSTLLRSDSEAKTHSSLDYHIFKQNLIPIVVLLVHKLASTCYYVSFFVVYKASPDQIIHRNSKKVSKTNMVLS